MEGTQDLSASSETQERFWFVEIIDRLSAGAAVLSTIGLLVMVSIICYEVVSRYVFNEPTFWVTEISTYILLGLTFLALAQAQREGSHIQVELLIGWVSPENRKTLNLVSGWLGCFFLCYLAWQFVVFVRTEYVNDMRDWGLLSTPMWMPETPLAIGLITFVLAVLADQYRQRPPAGNFRKWCVPVVVVVAALVLVALGRTPDKIAGTRIDWGSATILLHSPSAWCRGADFASLRM